MFFPLYPNQCHRHNCQMSRRILNCSSFGSVNDHFRTPLNSPKLPIAFEPPLKYGSLLVKSLSEVLVETHPANKRIRMIKERSFVIFHSFFLINKKRFSVSYLFQEICYSFGCLSIPIFYLFFSSLFGINYILHIFIFRSYQFVGSFSYSYRPFS